MTTTPLANLPRDCWLQVLECLPKHDLDSLSRVSHDIRTSVEHFLYRSIHWDWEHPQVHKILCLLRTISERRELADHIRHVSFVWWDVESCQTNIIIPKGKIDWAKAMLRFRPTLRWARKIVRDVKFPPKLHAKWKARLLDGDAYVYATLLVSQLHNLRSLRLDFSLLLEGGFPGELLHQSLFGNAPPGVLTRFSKLEMVDYGSNLPITEFRDTIYSAEPCQFIPWFHLPSLKTLEIWLQSLDGITVFPGQMPKRSWMLPNLRTLVLAKAGVYPDDIATLLCQFPYLESLHVGMAYKCRVTTEFLEQPECFLRSLETSSQTIKHLSISLELLPYCADNFRLRLSGDPGKPFRDMLKKFPQLKTASVPLYFLIGWGTRTYELRDVLPSTIEALHLSLDPSLDLWSTTSMMVFEVGALGALKSLMRHKERGSRPSLITFSFDGMHEHNEELLVPNLREAIHLLCLSEGYNLFSRYENCTPGFMLKSATLVNNVIYWFPWPFVEVDELPLSRFRRWIWILKERVMPI
ncbi:hypothetical protein N7491_001614 [Penicillium cf. griseofulvum]|uniref:F-box domain-containing protein n=1 Tax=Penicillium cf. griseofulvum TaxID=2972120 RepID=A0A9W9JC07_9EURO|nr:hypothetical protein N7472_006744 [Penicillium cf. griseofulvum]KAJ5445532.1 hypothetical protein N7491_001614 [Penicillium cf. griseofulvum]KAJ5447252.1 hypothetical protein N7445_002073 [Penicillium cf. griseofulvum]